MIFALDIDDGALRTFPTATEVAAHCKAIDVKDGFWLFFDEDGSPLEARFERPEPVGDADLSVGNFDLQRAMAGLWLQERLSLVVTVGGNGPSTVDELVDSLQAERARRAARGGRSE